MTLLALDHSRRPPWGPLHGVVVACFLLQHPADPRSAAQPAVLLEQLRAYVDGGLAAHDAAAAAARRSNSHRVRRHTRPAAAAPPAPPRIGSGVTIADVAVDGTFPADGHEERVLRWAASVLRGDA